DALPIYESFFTLKRDLNRKNPICIFFEKTIHSENVMTLPESDSASSLSYQFNGIKKIHLVFLKKIFFALEQSAGSNKKQKWKDSHYHQHMIRGFPLKRKC